MGGGCRPVKDVAGWGWAGLIVITKLIIEKKKFV